MKRRKKVGLALGSGASRGWSHLGIIKALQENNIPIDYVAGTSIGAYVGAIFASGHFENFLKIVLDMDWKKVISFLDPSVSFSGLLEGKKVMDLAEEVMGVKIFEELKTPLCVVAANLKTGEEIIFSKGPLREAIHASIAVPGIIRPVKINNIICVDGGILNPVPVNVVREMGADIVIAVDLNRCLVGTKKKNMKKTKAEEVRDNTLNTAIYKKFFDRFTPLESFFQSLLKSSNNNEKKEKDGIPGFREVYHTSIDIIERQIARLNLSLYPPDILIMPDLGYLKFFDFDKGEEIIQEGYNKAMQQMEHIKHLVYAPGFPFFSDFFSSNKKLTKKAL